MWNIYTTFELFMTFRSLVTCYKPGQTDENRVGQTDRQLDGRTDARNEMQYIS